jgi:hypothetical protein
MQAIRVETVVLQDGTLTVENLPLQAGDSVEVIILVQEAQTKASPKVRKAGSAKGQIWISDDFDEPLEDFREYME